MGNSPETSEFPAQMASNAENISIWWRHHDGMTTYTEVGSSHERLGRDFLDVKIDHEANRHTRIIIWIFDVASFDVYTIL